MQVTNLKLESNMKEELLEAIYGTVERLEQKVDELSASTKNAGAETVPASNDITKLDKSINAMFIKEDVQWLGAAGGAVLCAEALTAKGYIQAK